MRLKWSMSLWWLWTLTPLFSHFPSQKHAAVADYRLHSCMFHTTSKHFIGRFHDSMSCGLVESLQSGAVVCPIEQARQYSDCVAVIFITVSPWSRSCHNHYSFFFQNAFFYSPQVDASLILVTELTATCEHCAASFPALHHSYTAVMESWEWKSYCKRQ